ncbi:hypothetical protein ACFT2C_08910 [Promicromonospora sp. NPDC057138]|uniref:hypothetical protein n=1 Tax=Promicromonospora sp. NPDC057138 TaxID=3346031 RepID=UPI003630897B
MAARSYLIQLTNLTGLALRLDPEKTELIRGRWTDAPPDVIGNSSTAHFGSESDGFMTGTEGRVTYTSSSGDFLIYWDNPFVGADETSVQTPPGFTASKEDSGGDNATLKVVLYAAP